MIRPIALCLVLALSACTEVETAVDRTGRQAATKAVTEVIAINFPQVPKELIEPFVKCVVDNAQAIEVRELAKASVVGPDDLTIEVVRAILARPATQSCIRSNATLTL
ncbi:hypothetical protein [Sulfitobacter sp. S190]|uniref:hypothetical protein n=1 Tax=Sulfitobacter sp. S190 TaxID=2867022 RepID=UPI0021A7C29B|nr:hypothetical protein [Sulfitobacter sp. S190]UWR21680.1 hypothetical protein K3756_13430 [Sulfitobacter sp. S190]